MLKKIVLLVCNNQYQSKRYFTSKFAEAMQRKGLETTILQWQNGPVPLSLLDEIKVLKPDLTFSFNQPGPDEKGLFFWDYLKIPHWTFLVDPSYYDREMILSPYSILSCVDKFDCQMLDNLNFKKNFFCPHAVERELFTYVANERIYDVVFLGTCYDPDGFRNYLKQFMPPNIFQVFEEAAEMTLSDLKINFLQATMRTLLFHGLTPKDINVASLVYCVDSYVRGVDRLCLIRSIKDANVHIFGGRWFVKGPPAAEWSSYFSSGSNVKVHASVTFVESLEILKKSKICLNSMPFFKCGTHERIFYGLGCGALPITTRNIYIQEQFEEGKEILFYDFKNMDKVNELVNTYLMDNVLREQIVDQGRQKVMQYHTWENRADTMLENIGSILGKL